MTANFRIKWAWIALCCSLAVHVTDEAITGFLSVYNPTVVELRQLYPWLPFPVFRFEVWISGLALGIFALVSLSGPIYRGTAWVRTFARIFAVLMFANGIGHILGNHFRTHRRVGGVRSPHARLLLFPGPDGIFALSARAVAQALYQGGMKCRTG